MTTADQRNPFDVDDDAADVAKRANLAAAREADPEPRPAAGSSRSRTRSRPRGRMDAMSDEAEESCFIEQRPRRSAEPFRPLGVALGDTRAGRVLEELRRTLEAAEKGQGDGS